MPVFFFIDPEITDDPSMESCSAITLSYTFFKTDEDDDEDIKQLLLDNRERSASPAQGKFAPPSPSPSAGTVPAEETDVVSSKSKGKSKNT